MQQKLLLPWHPQQQLSLTVFTRTAIWGKSVLIMPEFYLGNGYDAACEVLVTQEQKNNHH